MENKSSIKFTGSFTAEENNSLGITDSQSLEARDIGKKIYDSIKAVPQKIANDALHKVQTKIESGKHAEAITLLVENAFFILKLKDERVLEIIKSIDSSNIDKSLRKDHLTLGLGYASHIGQLRDVKKYIEILEDEFLNDLNDNYINGFILEKARFAEEEGKRHSAVFYYQDLSRKEHASPRDVAVAYQGLADLSSSDEDKAYYSKLCADKFLEAGHKKSAIFNLLILSKLQSKENPDLALDTIETCLTLASSDDLLDRHERANLLQEKATYLYKLSRAEEALEALEAAFELDEGVFGAEANLYTSYLVASRYATDLGLEDKALNYAQKADALALTIDDALFTLQTKVSNYYEENDQLSKVLLGEVLEFGNIRLIVTVLLKESINPLNTMTETMTLLDDALKYLEEEKEKYNDSEITGLVHFHFGLIYQEQGKGMQGNAEDSYLKSLDANPYNSFSAQNLAALYMKEEQWEKAEKFFSRRVKLLGELPNICFLYGKALYKQHKYQKSWEYLNKANPDVKGLQELKEGCISNMSKGQLVTNFQPEIILQITSDDILEALKEFSDTVSSKNRMYFWQSDHKGGYKWKNKPEEIGKQLLIAFLSAKFGKDRIEILQEERAGAGFIDLYLLLAGGLKVVVELKMCGSPYSSSYAISGEDQIIHYQTNTGSNLGYLVVFDSRKRDYGKGFKNLQVVGNKTIYSIAIDVRNTIK